MNGPKIPLVELCPRVVAFAISSALALPIAAAGTRWSGVYESLEVEFSQEAGAEQRKADMERDGARAFLASQRSRTCSGVARSLAEAKHNVFERKRQLGALEQCLLERRTAALQSALDSQAILEANASFEANMKTVEDDKKSNAANRQFQGLGWGVGIGVSHAFDDVVSEGEVVNGIVRSTQDDTQQARVVLETHRYPGCKGDDPHSARRGCGPFGVVASGEDDVLAGVGFGFMYGWKAPDEEKGQGFSIGIGALLDNDIRTLADGFEDGQPLPPGETELRFETQARWSALLFFTRTF